EYHERVLGLELNRYMQTLVTFALLHLRIFSIQYTILISKLPTHTCTTLLLQICETCCCSFYYYRNQFMADESLVVALGYGSILGRDLLKFNYSHINCD
ncbi:hypothetical protein ACJX0J_031135, partial [Zea mays]